MAQPDPSFSLPDEVTSLLRPLASVSAVARGGRGNSFEARASRFGGKAAGLGDLASEGYPVPPGWVLDARYFTRTVDEQLPKGHDVASLLKLGDTRAGMDRAARARDRILGDALPADLRRALQLLWQAVEHRAPWGLSVRSSATSEDARGSSLAGLAHSVLGVRGHVALEQAFRQVWASLYLPRTLLYLRQSGVRAVAMPVLVMPMVEARAAGVLFTGPPPGLEGPRWRPDERVVHATVGLGCPVVEGASVVDTYRLSSQGAVIESVIASKTTELVVEAGVLVSRAVVGDRATEPALGPEALAQLGALALRMSTTRPVAQDVEFAVERSSLGAEKVVVLQARAITGGMFPEGGDAATVWSRANVGEALPGAATPLTWSVAKRFSEQGFRAAFGALGCSVPKDATLVANVYGRFYLNLSAFMDIAGQVPGLSPRAFLEQSGGVPDAIVEELEAVARSTHTRGFLLRAPFRVPGVVMRQIRLDREVAHWELDADKQRRRLAELDLELLPDDALAQTLTRASDLLFSAGELMLTCASASLVAYVALGALIARILRRREAHADDSVEVRTLAARIAQALTGGIAEIDSANPGLALMRVANLARRDPDAVVALLGGARSLDDLPHGLARSSLQEFLEDFGDRAIREAELMTPRWREDPTSLFTMLAVALRGPSVDPDAGPERARALADRELARLEASGSLIEKRTLAVLVTRVQSYTRLRERMRMWVTRTLGMIRAVALDVDRRLRRVEPGLEPGSVFFCTYDELVRALRAGRVDLGHIMRLRRAEYLRDAARPDPPASFVGRPPPITLPPSAAPKLTGRPASPGVVEGLARVLSAGSDASALEPGEILVARTSDVGMSPLFLLAAGVVTELGGPLSHAAIVAREYNVPAVVNVEGATLSIRTGERLRVDGDRGVVEKLDAPPRPVSLAGTTRDA